MSHFYAKTVPPMARDGPGIGLDMRDGDCQATASAFKMHGVLSRIPHMQNEADHRFVTRLVPELFECPATN